MMWMDSYLQETLIRDQIADARRQAARRYLLHCLKASRPRRRYRAVVQQLIEAVSVSGRRIASRVLRARLGSPRRANDRRPLLVPAPDSVAVKVHTAEPAIDAVERHRIGAAGAYLATAVGKV